MWGGRKSVVPYTGDKVPCGHALPFFHNHVAHMRNHNPHPIAGKLVGLINLDTPILTYEFQDVIAFGAERSTIMEAVTAAITGEDIKLTDDPAPERASFVRSDHYAFVKIGVPAVWLVPGPTGPGAAARQEFLTRHYHGVTDDMRQPFDWGAAAKFARINFRLARRLANDPQPPRWYASDYFGERFARRALKAKREEHPSPLEPSPQL
jgi:Zn-dependent M28 family amino/carboxypeptidase